MSETKALFHSYLRCDRAREARSNAVWCVIRDMNDSENRVLSRSSLIDLSDAVEEVGKRVSRLGHEW